jgi:hypothetical protein
MDPMRVATRVLVLVAIATAVSAHASDALQFHGFALLRGAVQEGSINDAPLDEDSLSAQIQVGIDWRPSPSYGGQIHLLARNESDGSHRGRLGIVQAYLDQTFVRGDHRLRLTEGAFFLPTSRENVDALWESPYTITSSALNSWFGEELRPIGIDAAYTLRRQWTAGVTVFRGNDTLGSFPAERGWSLRDHWALLGEHLPVDEEYFTSVSAENDGRLGWSARARWNNDRASVQYTHLDNRADALPYGHLFNWDTRFDILGGEITIGDWIVASEYGWGATDIIEEGERYSDSIAAGYVLVSRRLANGRVSLRGDTFALDGDVGHALTAAYFWSPRGKLRTGIEAIVSGDDKRASLEMRYHF